MISFLTKSFSYCNYSRIVPKRKGQNTSAFLLLELLLCLGAMVSLSFIIIAAQVSATQYFLRARMLQTAVDLARETLDQALCTDLAAGEQKINSYKIFLSRENSECRVIVTWRDTQYRSVTLSGALSKKHLTGTE